MSVIAGELRLQGGPPDAADLATMLSAMRMRAPDASASHATGPVLLGHAQLRTGASRAEAMPRLSLEPHAFVVADARIDNREALVSRLRASGRDARADDPHAELILHAYHVFGDDCAKHLHGDFAFAIWDARRHTLFLARDRFGVRPLYWALLPDRLLFASDMRALLALRAVPRELDERSLADFLMLGTCLDARATIHRHIRCVAPASWARATADGLEERAYWRLPEEQDPILDRKPADWQAAFAETLLEAVSDRLPEGPLALQLSGGLDSTSIAAMAVKARGGPDGIVAQHFTTRSLQPADDEWRYAGLVADALGIPLEVHDIGQYLPLAPLPPDEPAPPFPLAYPLHAAHFDAVRAVVRRGARVQLSGYLGDPVLAGDPTRAVRLLRQGRWLRFAREARDHAAITGSLRGLGLRGLFSRPATPAWKPRLPDWLDADWIREHAMQARWDAWWEQHEAAEGPLQLLALPALHRRFETEAAPASPLEFRYPFTDIRLLELLLSMPSAMRQDKRVLREAMAGILPPDVRLRPKSGAVGDVVRGTVASGKFHFDPHLLDDVPGIDRSRFEAGWLNYVAGAGSESTWASWLSFQPLALGGWRRQQQRRVVHE